jgi:hypothetical protein
MAAGAETVDTRRALETRLIEKAWKDPEFRKQVVSDPKGMLEKQIGQKLPENLKIYIHEEDANTLHFSVPPIPADVSELSDEELGRVAGGTELLIIGVSALFTAVTAAASVTGAKAGL